MDQQESTDPGPSRRTVLRTTAAAGAVTGIWASGALPAWASDRRGELVSENLTVTVDPDFPRVVGYRWTATGDTLGGAVESVRTVRVNGSNYTPAVTSQLSADRAAYRISVPELDVSVDVELTLKGDVLRFRAVRITERGATRISTFGLPGLGLVSASAAQQAALSHCPLTYGLGGPEAADVFVASADATADATWRRTSYAMLDTGRLAAAVESFTCAQDRLMYRTSDVAGVHHTEIASGEWVYRGADGKVFGLPEAAVVVTADRNGDGVADWQDAAIAFRTIMRNPYADDWSRTRVVQGIAINIASNADQPFLTTLDEIRRTYLHTDGLPQAILLKGYQSEGHDSGHMDYGGHYNTRAGGLAALRTLTKESRRYNAAVGVHINAWEEYPESRSFRWDRSNGVADLGWRWMDQSWHTDTVKDQATGAFAKRFAGLTDDLPHLGFVYSDTYWTGGWAPARQGQVITGAGLPLGGEADAQFERDSVFTYAGQTGSGLKSTIIRFIRNHQRDAWNRTPLLRGADNTHYMGWQSQQNLKNWLKATFTVNLPTKFLQHFEIQRMTVHQVDLTSGVSVSDATGTARITWNGRLIADGTTVFLPWEPTDEADPRKIYHWNSSGGATSWRLPAKWAQCETVGLYRLGEDGRTHIGDLPVTRGTVTVTADAATAYVLYRTVPSSLRDPDYGRGGLLANPSFTSRTTDGWTVPDSGQVTVTDDGNGLPYLRIAATGARTAAQRLARLTPGTYSASVWVRITGTRKAALTVSGHGGPETTVCATSSPLTHKVNNARWYRTSFQRMKVLFTVPGDTRGTALLTLSAEAGAEGTRVDFADVRVVANEGADPQYGGHWFAEDFEHVDEGWGPFVYTGGGEGNRTHLSETHENYTRDTVNGRFSLKTLSDNTGVVYRTMPQTLRFAPGRAYRIRFSYQADPGSDYRAVVARDGGSAVTEDLLPPTTTRALDAAPPNNLPVPAGWDDSLPPQHSATHRVYEQTVITGGASCGDMWLGIKHNRGAAFVLDDLVVDDLGPADTGTLCPTSPPAQVAVAPALYTRGAPGTVKVSFTNSTGAPLSGVVLTLDAPEGWQVTPDRQPLDTVADGATATAEFTVTPPAADLRESAGSVRARAAYPLASGTAVTTAAVPATPPLARLSDAYNSTMIARDAHPAEGSFDSGNSYSAEALTAAGAAPGTQLTVDGLSFTLPDYGPGRWDNAAGGGGEIALSGRAREIGFLGASAGGITGQVAVHYTDGTTDTANLYLPNWLTDAPTANGARTAVTTDHRVTPSGPANYGLNYRLYVNTVPVNPDKELHSLTLPSQSTLHILALTPRR
ncbi:endo-alpha-N-acetylgalactosaminidase family protein [Streptomyces sp. NPDC056352]|uniref:endo-alpha-N-acetylgalactosaminidase family protein n=1 Tax=Streptomyces sp. NPDC056352 TaxID=3345791 RepID=UPI0035D89EB0